MTRWLGIDVGGANLKVAFADTYAASVAFELWHNREGLVAALCNAFAAAPAWDAVAATMTGELADCYETKTEGVRHITMSLVEAAAGRPVAVYRVDGSFADAPRTLSAPLPAAASNWHALARYAARWLPAQTGMVIDVGSTTTDMVFVRRGEVMSTSRTDTDRLQKRELLYMGVGRTPLCAVVDELPLGSELCPVAAELFATTADIYQVLNLCCDRRGVGADGRSLNFQHCVDRLARQICADRETFTQTDALAAAQYVYQRQRKLMRSSFETVLRQSKHEHVDVVVSGSGEFLARAALDGHPNVNNIVSWTDSVGQAQSSCAAAVAVSHLAVTECPLEQQ